MTARVAGGRTYAAWLVFISTTVFLILGLVFTFLAREASATASWGSSGVWSQVAFEIGAFSFPLAGIIVATRDPGNVIGRLFLAIGLAWGLDSFLTSYYTYGLEVKSITGAELALAIDSFLWIPAIGLTGAYLLLLFPTGKLLSPGWRPLARFSAFAMVAGSIGILFTPGSMADSGYPDVMNPIGIETFGTFFRGLSFFAYALPLCVIGSAISLVRRFRRSSGVERVQMQWIAAAAGVVGVLFPLSILVTAVADASWDGNGSSFIAVVQNLALFSLVLIPIACGIAIVKHRLYDIDVIVNRTVVYGSLTAVLALTYLALVVVLQQVLSPISAQSDLAIAASTLAVAALFRPLRTRIQAFIDRRFYRRKYNARQTLDSFALTMRNQVDIESLRSDLLSVVASTMQPAHASLWLKGTETS